MVQGPSGIRYIHGVWGSDKQGRSSNYKELRNLVDAIEIEVLVGTMVGAELFLYTDNTVAEAAFLRAICQVGFCSN